MVNYIGTEGNYYKYNWKVSFSVVGSTSFGGTITSSEDGEYVSFGKSVTFTISPDEGYYVKDILVNNVSVGPADSYTIEFVNNKCIITNK